MTAAEQARRQLEAGLEQGFALPFEAQNALPVDDGVRDSAVLVLFGALDRVPAAEDATAAVDASIPPELDVLGLLPEVHIPVSGYLVTPVLGWWRLPSEVAADRSESVQVFRVPVAELIDPAARGTTVVRYEGRTFRGPAFRLGPQLGGHLVWGFTAMLLSGVFDSLGWSQPWDEGRLFEVER